MLDRLVHSIRRIVCRLWHTVKPSAPAPAASVSLTPRSDMPATTAATEFTTDSDEATPPARTQSDQGNALRETQVQPDHVRPAAISSGGALLLAEDALRTSDSHPTSPVQAPPGHTGHVDSLSRPTRADRAKNLEHLEPVQNDISDERSERTHGQPKRRSKPVEMGGQRAERTDGQAPTRREPQAARAELICRKNAELNQWELVLSVGDESSVEDVQQDGRTLDLATGERALSSFCGHVMVVFASGERKEITLEDKGEPLVFKLQKNWNGDGRKVKGIGMGHYIVIAPRAYKRTGQVPVEHEACTDPNFTAHYFLSDGKSPQEIDGFRERDVPSTQSVIELKGKIAFDDLEQGDLFVGDAPRLMHSKDTVHARIGEEGGRWKGEDFKTNERDVGTVLGNRQGRFFVRIYDADMELLDSDQFRYLRDLEEILVNGKPYSEDLLLVPTTAGHLPTEVRFIGVDGANVHPVLSPEAKRTNFRGTSVLVDPHPDADRASCVIASDTGSVDVVLALPRVWWHIAQEDMDAFEWSDVPTVMTRQEFCNRGYDGATLRLRAPRRIKSVRVGFDGQHDHRSYPLKLGKINGLIPLLDFVDYPQIDQRLSEDASLDVECDGVTATVIRIAADPIPAITSFVCEPSETVAGEPTTLRWEARNASEARVAINPSPQIVGTLESNGSLKVRPLRTTTYELVLIVPGVPAVTKAVTATVLSSVETESRYARVKCLGGWRRGKGFSRRELEAAGLTTADANRRSIFIDRRRRSMHRENVETIGRLVNG